MHIYCISLYITNEYINSMQMILLTRNQAGGINENNSDSFVISCK